MLRIFFLPLIFIGSLFAHAEHLEQWLSGQFLHEEGVAIGVVSQGDLIWSYPRGLADQEHHLPATEQTIFRIASLTKVFSAIAVLQLAERGLLRLDDPVEKHLVWFRMHSYTEKQSMTIRDLLTHSSGLEREPYFSYGKVVGYPSKSELQKHLPQESIHFKPGEALMYSNLGYVILGWIVEKASGMPFERYLQQKVIGPLQMKSTLCKSPAQIGNRFAWGYKKGVAEPNCHISTKGMTSAFGLYSNLLDLSKIMAMLQGYGKSVLKKGSIQKMVEPQFTRKNLSWSIGLCHYRKGGKSLLVHSGNLEGFVSFLGLDHEEDLGVIVLANDESVKAGTIGLTVLEYFTAVPLSERDREKITPFRRPAPSVKAPRQGRGGRKQGSSSRKDRKRGRKARPGASSSNKSTSTAPDPPQNSHTYQDYGKKQDAHHKSGAKKPPSNDESEREKEDQKRLEEDLAARQALLPETPRLSGRQHREEVARELARRKDLSAD